VCFEYVVDGDRFAIQKVDSRKSGFKGVPLRDMSCRIDRVVIGENLVVLRVSGRIAGQDVYLLQTLLEQECGTVAIDLKDVLLVDREAVKLLALRESGGAGLRNCPAYIRQWVTRERECHDED
jgi:hypothetical protein